MGETGQEGTKARRRLGRQRSGGTFDAFISYSHAADADVAPALRAGLHSLAKPWYRLRATRVFLDETSMAANSGLWSTLTGMLTNTEHFVLLASPEAAASQWVGEEVTWWCANKPPERLVIGLTGGDIDWDDDGGDFNWTVTTALPPQLRGVFREEPRYIDLRRHDHQKLSLADAGFRDDVADFASVIRNRPKDDLLGEDVRLHRRARRQARTAIFTLAALLVLSVVSCGEAARQRDQARTQARRALSRQLAAQATVLRPDRLDLSLLLSVEAMATDATSEAEASVLAGLAENPQLTYSRALAGTPGRDLAYDPARGELAWGTGEGVILWDVAARSGRTLAGLTDVGPVATSSTGVLAASGEEGVMLWDPGGRESTGPPLAASGRLAFSRDGAVLAVIDRSAVTFFDVASRQRRGEPVAFPRVGEGSSCADVSAASPDLRLVAFATTGECTGIMLWDLERGAAAGTAALERHEPINALAFSPDGRTLASGSGTPRSIEGRSGSVRFWDVEGLAPRAQAFVTNRHAVTDLAFSPDGRFVAAAADTIRGISGVDGVTIVVEASSGTQRGEPLRSDGKSVQAVAFGSDRSLAAVATTSDRSRGAVDASSVALWNLGAGDRRAEALTTRPTGTFPWVDAVAFSPDGGVLAINTVQSSSKTREVTLWDTRARQQLGGPLPGGRAVEFSPDGRRLAVVEGGGFAGEPGNLSIWDVARHEQVGSIITGAAGVAFDPEGATVAVGRPDGSILLWDVEAGREVAVLAARPPIPVPPDRPTPSVGVRWLAFGSDGNTLLAGREDGLVTQWSLDGERPVERELTPGTQDGFLPEVSDVAFSPDRKLVAVSVATRGDLGVYGSMTLWDVGRQEQLYVHAGPVTDVAFARDGGRFVAADPGGTAVVWDVGRLRPLDAPVLTAGGHLYSVSLDPDGRLAAGTDIGALLSTIDPAAWRTAACSVFGTKLSPSESAQFLGAAPRDGCA